MPNRPKTHRPFGAGNNKGKVHKAPRPSAAKRKHQHYDTARWRYRLRPMVLRRWPFCAICEIELSTEVDHIVSLADGGTDSLDNLQGVCHRCHSRKTVVDDGRGFGKAKDE